MKTKVDDYKGFEIYFDTDSGKFIVEGCDSQDEKPSYNSAKKFVDDFLKENNMFPEFKLTNHPRKRMWGKKDVTVQGLHGNGNLLAYDEEKQERFQLSTYNWNDYIFPEDLKKCGYDSDKVKKLEAKLEKLRLEVRGEIKKEEDKLPDNTKEKINKIIEGFKYK